MEPDAYHDLDRADRGAPSHGRHASGSPQDGNLLVDPGFDVVDDDGTFVHWTIPLDFRYLGEPDKGACLMVEDFGICLQRSSQWERVPMWSEIDEASVALRCAEDGCFASLDVALEVPEADCVAPADTDTEGNPVAFWDDYFFDYDSENGVCVYLQFFVADRGWRHYTFTLDIPDGPVGSFAVGGFSGGVPLWADDAVFSE